MMSEVSWFVHKKDGYHRYRNYRCYVTEPGVKAEDFNYVSEYDAAKARYGEPDSKIKPERLVHLLFINTVRQNTLDNNCLSHKTIEEQ